MNEEFENAILSMDFEVTVDTDEPGEEERSDESESEDDGNLLDESEDDGDIGEWDDADAPAAGAGEVGDDAPVQQPQTPVASSRMPMPYRHEPPPRLEKQYNSSTIMMAISTMSK